jgi:glutamate 5-kinase
MGNVTIDAGAVTALLEQGKSLLPSGITHVDGEFHPGDLIQVLDADGQEVARGLSNYGSEELQRIQGRKSSEIQELLGHKHDDEVIHRNNMVCR